MTRKKWTNYEIAYLKAHYPDEKTGMVAAALNRSERSVYMAAKIQGLKKSAAYLQTVDSGRLTPLSAAGYNYRFKKGSVPPNKGKKMPAAIYNKVKATMFRKGNLPHNTKHDGGISKRYDSNGTPYYFIRISQSNWVALQKFNWEKINGEVPKGMFLRCKDGNTLNCAPDNWYLVTRRENMKLNSIHNYSGDIQQTVQLIGALNRQIHKHEKY